MSCTTGPCPRCGRHTMYDDREPTPCSQCRKTAVLVAEEAKADAAWRSESAVVGNRKARRAAKAKGRPA